MFMQRKMGEDQLINLGDLVWLKSWNVMLLLCNVIATFEF